MLATHYAAVLAQEYAHSVTAWSLGYKPNPFNIYFGGNSWLNIFTLYYVNENVNYALVTGSGHMKDLAIIAAAGPIFANGGLYLLSLALLASRAIRRMPITFYFLLWFNLMNLANIYGYIPIRVFSPYGDIAHILQGLSLSPWSTYIVGIYFVGFMLWYFFSNTLLVAYDALNLDSVRQRAFLMICCALPLFGYYGLAGLMGHGTIANVFSVTSFVSIPAVLYICWPARSWVVRQVQALRTH